MSRQSPGNGAQKSRCDCRKEEVDTALEENGEDDEQQEGQQQDIKKASRVRSKSKKPRLIF